MLIDFFAGNRTIERILHDISGTVKYLNVGIAIAIIYVAIYISYVFICAIIGRDRRYRKGHAVSVFLLLIYVTTLMSLVFMSREVGQFEGINLKLFSTWGRTYVTRALFIENIIMFIPMGMLLPSAFKRFRKFYKCVFVCFCLTVFIELVQLIFSIGYFELDDIMTNTVGGIIGWLIWRLFFGIISYFEKDKVKTRFK